VNPLKLSAVNYRSYEHVEIDLPAGCLAIVGTNGSGKSSLVNLIDLCLFGPQSRSLSEYVREDTVDEEMVLGLEFEHDGETYRVRRTFSARGRGKSALDFEVQLAHRTESVYTWEPLTREDQKATQALIEQTIGLSRETFRASAFLAQGDGAAFTEAQPRDRKRILGEVLGLGVWDSLLALARAERAGVESEASKLATQIEEAERDLENQLGVKSRVEEAGAALIAAEKALAEAEEKHRHAADRLAQSRETMAKLAAAKEVLQSREREVAEANQRHKTIKFALEEAAGLPALLEEAKALAAGETDLEQEKTEALHSAEASKEVERLSRERTRILEEWGALNRKAEELRAEARRLADVDLDAEPCKACGRPLESEEARQQTIANLNEAADNYDAQATGKADVVRVDYDPLIAKAEERANDLGGRVLDLIEADLKRARAAREEAASIEERLRQVERLEADLGQIKAKQPDLERLLGEQRTAVAELEDALPGEDLEAAVARAYSTLSEARTDATAAKSRLAVANAELERLSQVAARAEANKVALADRQKDLDLLHLAERAYGPNGVPALIVENAAIPSIEVEACRILGELGTDFRVELRTQRQKKSGDGVSDTLDIVILSGNGERLYESLSGGERSRVNVALRIALARLLAHRRGAESRILILDEVEYLDEPGQERLAQVLHGLTADFDKVILVSHVPGLRDAFDATITVSKDEGGYSQIDTGAVALEEVTA
jgi:DNA repair exonuclease SbcCD ATPase subunit